MATIYKVVEEVDGEEVIHFWGRYQACVMRAGNDHAVLPATKEEEDEYFGI